MQINRVNVLYQSACDVKVHIFSKSSSFSIFQSNYSLNLKVLNFAGIKFVSLHRQNNIDFNVLEIKYSLFDFLQLRNYKMELKLHFRK